MSLFDIFKDRNKNTNMQIQDIKPNTTESDFKVLKSENKRMRILSIPDNSQSRYEINPGLIELYKLYRSDSILKRTVWIYTTLCLGNGFTIKSTDYRYNSLISKRIKEIETNSGTTMYEIVRNLFSNFIAFGNLFAIFNRTPNMTSGNQYKFNGKTLNPISSIFVGHPVSMSILRDRYGEPIAYSQDLSFIMRDYGFWMRDPELNIFIKNLGQQTTTLTQFERYNVLHFKYEEDILTGFGRPFYFEAIDDIILLRKIERIIEELISTGKIMQQVYTVGNDKYPARSQKDIDDAIYMLQAQDPFSTLVVPHNHNYEIKLTNVLQDILTFYDKIRHRVYGVLGIGSVFMGESNSSNRLNSEVTGQFLYALARELQNIFLLQFETLILQHIVADLDLNPKRLGDAMPKLIFNDPDVDLLIKKQNQAVFLYEHSAVTRSEMRLMLGMNNIPDSEENDMYIYRVKIPLSVGSKTSDDIINGGETENKVNPQNQYTVKR